MYQSSFQLGRRPFMAAPQLDAYFPAQSIETARQTLASGIRRGAGPGLVIGPAGTGKTLLCHKLASQFRSSAAVALLVNTQLDSRRALLQLILFELGLPYRGLDEGELRLSLIDHVTAPDQFTHGMVLLVDEAHCLTLKLLEEIRMLSNLVHDGQARVHVVLAGSAALEERFTSPKLDAFNQRVVARAYLDALNREETLGYIQAQVASAGGNAMDLFDEDAFEVIHDLTNGVPRLINQVCDHALILAAAGGHSRLGATGIQEAWADLQHLPAPLASSAASECGELGDVVEFGSLDDEQCDDGPAFEADPEAGLEPVMAAESELGPEAAAEAELALGREAEGESELASEATSAESEYEGDDRCEEGDATDQPEHQKVGWRDEAHQPLRRTPRQPDAAYQEEQPREEPEHVPFGAEPCDQGVDTDRQLHEIQQKVEQITSEMDLERWEDYADQDDSTAEPASEEVLAGGRDCDEPPLAYDPFAEPFEEEELVVIDRLSSLDPLDLADPSTRQDGEDAFPTASTSAPQATDEVPASQPDVAGQPEAPLPIGTDSQIADDDRCPTDDPEQLVSEYLVPAPASPISASTDVGIGVQQLQPDLIDDNLPNALENVDQDTSPPRDQSPGSATEWSGQDTLVAREAIEDDPTPRDAALATETPSTRQFVNLAPVASPEMQDPGSQEAAHAVSEPTTDSPQSEVGMQPQSSGRKSQFKRLFANMRRQ